MNGRLFQRTRTVLGVAVAMLAITAVPLQAAGGRGELTSRARQTLASIEPRPTDTSWVMVDAVPGTLLETTRDPRPDTDPELLKLRSILSKKLEKAGVTPTDKLIDLMVNRAKRYAQIRSSLDKGVLKEDEAGTLSLTGKGDALEKAMAKELMKAENKDRAATRKAIAKQFPEEKPGKKPEPMKAKKPEHPEHP